MLLPKKKAPVRTLAWLALLALVVGAFIYSRASRLEVAGADCTLLTHDRDPWIVPPERIAGYCERPAPATGTYWSRRRSDFDEPRTLPLGPLDPAVWQAMDATFECNLARFVPGAIEPAAAGAPLRLHVRAEAHGDRALAAGAIATVDRPDALHRYGRYEVVMKPARGSGLISAFFLHRRDPWQEIDLEILGRDTTKLLLNVYFNPGVPGDLYNYGFTGTPVLVDLGFDAADAFHRYAIEWDLDEIRWFVDDRLVHRRRAGRPTPIPHLPMRLHLNVWANCSEALVGPLTAPLPASAEIREVTISRHEPVTLYPIWHFFDGLFGSGPVGSEAPERVWQDDAEWLQRHRAE